MAVDISLKNRLLSQKSVVYRKNKNNGADEKIDVDKNNQNKIVLENEEDFIDFWVQGKHPDTSFLYIDNGELIKIYPRIAKVSDAEEPGTEAKRAIVFRIRLNQSGVAPTRQPSTTVEIGEDG